MVSSNTPGGIIDYADKDFVSLDENTLVADAARIMYERGVCSVIITRDDVERHLRQAVGMILLLETFFNEWLLQAKVHLNWP